MGKTGNDPWSSKKPKTNQRNHQFKSDLTIVFLSSDLKHKTTNMPTSYKQSVSTMNKSALAQESATAAPLHVSWKT